jgi:ubiquinone/menaquinone biosynthesis C-methylase UbiE
MEEAFAFRARLPGQHRRRKQELMDFLKASWGKFTGATAREFLRTTGAPAHTSMDLMVKILRDRSRMAPTDSLLDIGCGNASVYSSLKAGGLSCRYIGIDFSSALLRAGREIHPEVGLFEMDARALALRDRSIDYVVFSHVLEMLSSPELALRESRRVCRKSIIIRFFEPPVFEFDETELRFMEYGGMGKVPYLRRKMSKNFYDMMLSNCGIRSVDVYQDVSSKDQIHVLDAA